MIILLLENPPSLEAVLHSNVTIFTFVWNDAFAAYEQTAFDCTQQDIRADVYDVSDCLLRQDIDTRELGRRVILPTSFTGGDRYMQQLFQDSMAIVRHFGRPTYSHP